MGDQSEIEAKISDVKQPVSQGTVIGRRFEQGALVSDDKGAMMCTYKAFIDKRVDDDLSFDALGYHGNIDKKIVCEISSIVSKHLSLTGTRYLGWIGLKRKTIAQHQVYSTPDAGREHPNPNPFHCSLDRSGYPTREAARSLAYELMFHANNDRLFVMLEEA